MECKSQRTNKREFLLNCSNKIFMQKQKSKRQRSQPSQSLLISFLISIRRISRHSSILKSVSREKRPMQKVGLSLSSLMCMYQKQLKTSEHYVLGKRASICTILKRVSSIGWFPTSWCRVVILQREMVLVVSVSMGKSSTMRPFGYLIHTKVFFQW